MDYTINCLFVAHERHERRSPCQRKVVHFILLDGNFLLQTGCDFCLGIVASLHWQRRIRSLPDIEGLTVWCILHRQRAPLEHVHRLFSRSLLGESLFLTALHISRSGGDTTTQRFFGVINWINLRRRGRKQKIPSHILEKTVTTDKDDGKQKR